MNAEEALLETRRLLSSGVQQILQVDSRSFDQKSTEAWPAFRRGVVRADGCREVPSEELLHDLDGKLALLNFMADFAERKRGYRKQVENVLRILMKGPAWIEVALSDPSLSQRLPGAEVAELLSAAGSAGGTSGTRPRGTAPLAVRAGAADVPPDLSRTESRDLTLSELRSGCTALADKSSSSDIEQVLSAYRLFSANVSKVLKRGVDSDTKALADLEPKVPVLTVLCSLYERRRSERSRVTALLLSLLETPALASWRCAATADSNLRKELEHLGVMDHGYGNEAECESADEPSPHPGKIKVPKASDSPRSRASSLQAMWMWRDSASWGGPLFHAFAVRNPVRWSNCCSLRETLEDLKEYLDTPSGERPVKVRIFRSDFETHNVKAKNVADAIVSLQEFIAAECKS